MAHALLSPSSASRWLNCPRSARLEETLPSTAGTAAQEGTLAHRLSEVLLKFEIGTYTKSIMKSNLALIKDEELYNEEMMDHCTDYVSYVMGVFQQVKAEFGTAVIYPEQHFDLSKYVPEGFGTCDNVIIGGNVMHIIDLKYGKGVPVDSANNKQLMLYGLGAYLEFEYVFDIDRIVMHIVQPRIDNSSTAEIETTELIGWANSVLKKAAEMADKGEGDFVPGSHCRFCRARATCRANAEYQMQGAVKAFTKPDLLDDEEVVEILKKAKDLEGWLTAVKDHALDEAILRNKEWPGMKLVAGRSNRKYSSETAVLETLLTGGYDKEDLGKFKLFGLGELEKTIGKKPFEEIVTPLLIKPPGKPVLVPVEDKRPAINSAEEAEKAFASE